jgi:OOP family OmpA-OmpF porin
MRLPSWSRYPISLLLLGSGMLLSATVDSGNNINPMSTNRYSAIEPAQFDVDYIGGRLNAYGHGADEDHERAIHSIAEQVFAKTDIALRPVIVAPNQWGALTNQVLRSVSKTESATVSVTPQRIDFRGIVTDVSGWQSELQSLAAMLPSGTTLQTDVVEVSVTSGDPCALAFDHLSAQRIEFDRSSAELRSAALQILDRYVQVTNDCHDRAVTIAGHTDALGDESWNVELSLARAQAVADYMSDRGISAERLVAEGKGSSQPIANNETAWGRVRNRRIEFELR